LNASIEKQKKEKQAARQRKQSATLDMADPESYLTEPQFDLFKEQIEKISKTMNVQDNNLEQLSKKLSHLLRPISAKYPSNRLYKEYIEKKRQDRNLDTRLPIVARVSQIHTPSSARSRGN